MYLTDILTDTEKVIGQQLLTNNAGVYKPVYYTNTDKAQELLLKNVNLLRTEPKHNIKIFFDIDFDGIASGYIMWKMLVELCQCDPTRIIPVINKERKHGITDSIVEEINNDENTILTVIVDSSTNAIETYTKLKTDLLIIDHHDVEILPEQLIGKTSGGDYFIINNTYDHIDGKSAAEVVYEFWYNISPSVLQSLMLEEWVAVSLYSDIIDIYNEQNVWFTWHLRNLRDNCDLMKILRPLDILDCCNGHLALHKSTINFRLVPLVNSCMRMQAGYDLVLTIMYRPHTIGDLKKCLAQQKELTDLMTTLVDIEDFGEVQTIELQKSKLLANAGRRPRNIVEMMSKESKTKSLEKYSETIIDGFKGMIAGKLSNDKQKTTFVYSIVEIDDEQYLKGSVRTYGRLANVGLRNILAEMEGWTASGHGDAFGFTYKLGEGRNTVTLANEVTALLSKIQYGNQRQTRFAIADYNIFNTMVQTNDVDSVNRIKILAEINNLKTRDEQYSFEITPSGGFIAPLHSPLTSRIHTHTFFGNGTLRIQLTSYDGIAEFELGITYLIVLTNCDGNTILGTVEKVSA